MDLSMGSVVAISTCSGWIGVHCMWSGAKAGLAATVALACITVCQLSPQLSKGAP